MKQRNNQIQTGVRFPTNTTIVPPIKIKHTQTNKIAQANKIAQVNKIAQANKITQANTIALHLPFKPSVPPKSCNVVHTKLASQNEALFHFFHSPSPFTDMSITLNLPFGVTSMKDFKALACCFEVQDTNAHPWSVEMLKKRGSVSIRGIFRRILHSLYFTLSFTFTHQCIASSEKLLGEGTGLLTGPNGVRICAV